MKLIKNMLLTRGDYSTGDWVDPETHNTIFCSSILNRVIGIDPARVPKKLLLTVQTKKPRLRNSIEFRPIYHDDIESGIWELKWRYPGNKKWEKETTLCALDHLMAERGIVNDDESYYAFFKQK